MSESTFVSLFAVHQATSDIDAQIAFYKQWGLNVDKGFDALSRKNSFPQRSIVADVLQRFQKSITRQEVLARLTFDVSFVCVTQQTLLCT
jgi:hypothetical protein